MAEKIPTHVWVLPTGSYMTQRIYILGSTYVENTDSEMLSYVEGYVYGKNFSHLVSVCIC